MLNLDMFSKEFVMDAIRRAYPSNVPNSVVPFTLTTNDSFAGTINTDDSSLTGLWGWHTLFCQTVGIDCSAVITTYNGIQEPITHTFRNVAASDPAERFRQFSWFGLIHDFTPSQPGAFMYSFVGWQTDQELYTPASAPGFPVLVTLNGADANFTNELTNIGAVPWYSQTVSDFVMREGEDYYNLTIKLPVLGGGSLANDWNFSASYGVSVVSDVLDGSFWKVELESIGSIAGAETLVIFQTGGQLRVENQNTGLNITVLTNAPTWYALGVGTFPLVGDGSPHFITGLHDAKPTAISLTVTGSPTIPTFLHLLVNGTTLQTLPVTAAGGYVFNVFAIAELDTILIQMNISAT